MKLNIAIIVVLIAMSGISDPCLASQVSSKIILERVKNRPVQNVFSNSNFLLMSIIILVEQDGGNGTHKG